MPSARFLPSHSSAGRLLISMPKCAPIVPRRVMRCIPLRLFRLPNRAERDSAAFLRERPRNKANARWEGMVLDTFGIIKVIGILDPRILLAFDYLRATTPCFMQYSRSLCSNVPSSAKRSMRIWRAPSSAALASSTPGCHPDRW